MYKQLVAAGVFLCMMCHFGYCEESQGVSDKKESLRQELVRLLLEKEETIEHLVKENEELKKSSSLPAYLPQAGWERLRPRRDDSGAQLKERVAKMEAFYCQLFDKLGKLQGEVRQQEKEMRTLREKR